ncbi:hypothetical protein PBY51_019461 [Eleginops maclovinus]|nr:hypothetical protein PBY51_019461 [Eleginops maclovinus]
MQVSLTTLSSCCLAEKPLHVQSWIIMELRFPKVSLGVVSLQGISCCCRRRRYCCSSSCPKNWDTNSSLSPREGHSSPTLPDPSTARIGDMGEVGTSSNLFRMSSLGAVGS